MSADTPPPSPKGNKLPAPERDRLGELLAPSQFVFAASCDLTATHFLFAPPFSRASHCSQHRCRKAVPGGGPDCIRTAHRPVAPRRIAPSQGPRGHSYHHRLLKAVTAITQSHEKFPTRACSRLGDASCCMSQHEGRNLRVGRRP